MSEEFLLFTGTIWAACLVTMLVAYLRSRDPFHPALVISAQLLFLYGFLPYDTVESGIVTGYLTVEQSARVQWINMIGVVSLSLGLLANTHREEATSYVLLPEGTPSQRGALRGAKLFGLVGVLSFAYIITTSGGMGAVYGRGYGGGWHDSGYVRELFLMTVPGILWYLIATASRPFKVRDAAWIGLFALPLLIHGILGARRGPVLVIAFTMVMGYFLSRRKRPSFALVTLGGAVLGLGVLLLVANRTELYLGSQLDLKTDPLFVFRSPETNEFVYGGAVILNAEHFDRYNWGGRYFAEVAIRPIPRAIWPSKYQDASEWFGLPESGSERRNGGRGLPPVRRVCGGRGSGSRDRRRHVGRVLVGLHPVPLPRRVDLLLLLEAGAAHGGPWAISFVHPHGPFRLPRHPDLRGDDLPVHVHGNPDLDHLEGSPRGEGHRTEREPALRSRARVGATCHASQEGCRPLRTSRAVPRSKAPGMRFVLRACRSRVLRSRLDLRLGPRAWRRRVCPIDGPPCASYRCTRRHRRRLGQARLDRPGGRGRSGVESSWRPRGDAVVRPVGRALRSHGRLLRDGR